MSPQGIEVALQYIPDGRESYVNAVEILHDLLQPKFDEDMKKISKEINDGLDKEFEEIKSKESKDSKIGLKNE